MSALKFPFVRIDDRLVHGQVVEGWIPFLRADLVLVASDAAAQDETQSILMRLALPDEVELCVMKAAKAARHPAFAEAGARRTLVLVDGPLAALELLEAGARFDEVNVGGLHYTAGRVQLGKAIFLSAADEEALRGIAARGVRLSGRALPDDPVLDVLALIQGRSGGAS
jgi:mannose/fructose/N-acetylgalactosamine-specific phosphotransferase system component IIB